MIKEYMGDEEWMSCFESDYFLLNKEASNVLAVSDYYLYHMYLYK